MAVWLSLFAAVVLTAGGFLTLYLLIVGIVEFKREKAKPRIGVCPGEKEGTMGFWVNWQANMFDIQFYRLKVSHASPESLVKEGSFTVTFDPVQKGPFLQPVELPTEFKELLTSGQEGKKSIITIELKTTQQAVVSKSFYLAFVKKVYLKQKTKTPDLPKLNVAPVDPPAVMSLEYGELVERRKRLKALDDEAKAKAAAKAAAAKAAAAAKPTAPAPGAPAPAGTAAPANPAAAAPIAPAAKPAVTPASAESLPKGSEVGAVQNNEAPPAPKIVVEKGK